ncbi:hypothetical protein GCM10023177_30370 [Streptomyces violaceoruber]
MFHQPTSHASDLSLRERVPTPADYGRDTERERSFTPSRADGLIPGRVVRAERGRCDVVTETGFVRATATPSSGTGDRLAPCTGDWVAVRPAGTTTDATLVAAVLERRTAVVRSTSSRTSRAQVLAANVDTVAVAVSLADPLGHGRIERMFSLAWDSGAAPVVVLTKADRCPDPASAAAEVAEVAPGVAVLVTGAATGEGLDVLTAVLSGTVVLLGPSGAGKSSVGNRLLGGDLLATGAVRDSDGKGRHTTTARELLPLPGVGVLPDTPACAASACTTPMTAWTGPSPRSPVWRGSAASRTAPTAPNRAAPSWPPSRTAASPGGAWTATTGCSVRTPMRPHAATPVCGPSWNGR